MPVAADALRSHLLEFLRGGSAHADADTALADFPVDLAGVRPEGSPHSCWELLEHLRITLEDLLRFCTDSNYSALQWPQEYWPGSPEPGSANAWNSSVAMFKNHLAAFEKMVEDPKVELEALIPWGEGQTILREVLLAGDHTSYHLGQVVLLRKQLQAWQT